MLFTAVAAVAATTACGESTEDTVTGPSDGRVTSGVIDATGSGDLDALPAAEAKIGDDIAVTGSEWSDLGAVRFYLLTEEQAEGSFLPGSAVFLGEATPREDGGISFRFPIAEAYDTPNGARVVIRSGQRWFVAGFQTTQPGSGIGGSHGSFVGPLTIR